MASKKVVKKHESAEIWTRLVDDEGKRSPRIALLTKKNPDWMTIGEATRLIVRLQNAVGRLERRAERMKNTRLASQKWPPNLGSAW